MSIAAGNPAALDLEAIAAEIRTLVARKRIVMPGLPTVALRARQVAADPDSSPARLATIISEDPALSAYLIKVSNSALQWRGHENRSVRGAVLRLGTRLTGVTATNFSLMQMATVASGHADRLRALYSHSIRVGELCHQLAQRHPRLVPDDAMLLGLVHDIGVVAILQYARLRPELKEPDALEAVIRELHAEAGAELLQAWKFAPELIEAVREHEDWDRGEPDADPDYADLLIVANIDCHGSGARDARARLDAGAVTAYRRLGLSPEIPLSLQLDLPVKRPVTL